MAESSDSKNCTTLDLVKDLLLSTDVKPLCTGVIIYIPYRYILKLRQGTRPGNVNRRQRNGDTALHIAVETGDEPVVRLLLELGANLNCFNALFGETPLTDGCGRVGDHFTRLMLSNIVSIYLY